MDKARFDSHESVRSNQGFDTSADFTDFDLDRFEFPPLQICFCNVM